MMKHLLVSVALITLLLIGCGGGGGGNNSSTVRNTTNDVWNIAFFTATGIVPTVGSYNIDVRGAFRVVNDANGIRVVQFASDSWNFRNSQVSDGTFLIEWGLGVNGTNYPTDGFAISGHFTDANTAVGQVKYTSGGQSAPTSESGFTATWSNAR